MRHLQSKQKSSFEKKEKSTNENERKDISNIDNIIGEKNNINNNNKNDDVIEENRGPKAVVLWNQLLDCIRLVVEEGILIDNNYYCYYLRSFFSLKMKYFNMIFQSSFCVKRFNPKFH